MDQLTARDLVLVGLVTQTVLALMFGLVWRSLPGRLASLAGIGFCLLCGGLWGDVGWVVERRGCLSHRRGRSRCWRWSASC